jgi:hypothetical protein
MLALILLPMGPTHSDVVDASGWLLTSGGLSDGSVSGGVGAWSFPT